MSERFYQTAFDLPVRSLTGRGDFFVAPENAAAVALIDSFPNAFFGAVIFGEKGSGKTHLAHLFAEAVKQKTGQAATVLTANELTEEAVIGANGGSLYLILENVAAPVDEKALFHLLNTAKNNAGFVLMTSERPPVQWRLSLPDLMTRLKALPCVEILPPDEMLMQAVLIKQFTDRQLKIAPEVIAYIMKNTERSFKAVAEIVKRADELSLERHCAVTIPLIRQVLNEIKD